MIHVQFKEISSGQYEIYLPGQKNWTTIQQIQDFIKSLNLFSSFLESGYYCVFVISNEMGSLFWVEKLEKYVYKRSVDLKIVVQKQDFFLKSSCAFVFSKTCYYYQGNFYGRSCHLSQSILVYEFVERVLEEEYNEAKKRGKCIKKGKEISSL